jgi:hypothetical protein
MIVTLLTLGLVISLTLLLIGFLIIKRLLNRCEIYEEWILDFKTDVISTLEEMRDIDKSAVFSSRLNDKGVFESDDIVGGVFKELVDLVEKLNQRTQ